MKWFSHLTRMPSGSGSWFLVPGPRFLQMLLQPGCCSDQLLGWLRFSGASLAISRSSGDGSDAVEQNTELSLQMVLLEPLQPLGPADPGHT